MLHLATALLACCAIPALVVAPYYAQRAVCRAARDSASVVAYRLTTTALTASLCVAAVHAAQPARCHQPLLTWLAVRVTPAALLFPVLAFSLLYAGPLLRGARAAKAASRAPLHVRVRDIVAAPVLEEVLFRGCCTRLLSSTGLSWLAVVLLSSGLFGLSHSHHVLEAVLLERTPLPHAVAEQAFQFLYTALFGFFAGTAHLATGSIAAPILLHALCNYRGVPLLRINLKRPADQRLVLLWLTCIAAFVILQVWAWSHPLDNFLFCSSCGRSSHAGCLPPAPAR